MRTAKDVVISDALTFMAGDRSHVEEAYPGDILGLHNHGTIQIGDTFTRGEMMKFTGIPNFAPELFRRIRLKDPLKQKQLLKGLVQLSEEGAVQVFRPISNNDLIVGAVGVLQFDVVVARLKSEYNVEAVYESVNVATARWVECADAKKFEEFKRKNESQLALDGGDNLAYIATSMVNLRWRRNVIGRSVPPDSRALILASRGVVAAAPVNFPSLLAAYGMFLKHSLCLCFR